jgi:chitodextrinase
LSGGAVNSTALVYSSPFVVTAPITINARVLVGSTWSALAAGVFTPTTSNTAPAVRAVGPITANLGAAITVGARVTDDGLPADTLSLQWSLVSGPGTAIFGSPDASSSTVSFSEVGSYVLRLTVSDGEQTGASDVPVFVYPQPPAILLESFTLMNADTGTPLAGFEAIMDGAVVDLATLPTRRLNIRANTNPSTVGSVRFALNTTSNYRTETVPPYALAGDTEGAYNPWTPALGDYTLKGTPYSGGSATGAVGTPLTVHFQVIDSVQASDATAPSVPTGLSADNTTASGFTLHWAASTDDVGVSGYEVFRDGTSAGTATATSKSLTGLAPSTTYAITVRARDAAGNWSAPSAPLDVTTSSAPPFGVDSVTLIDADTDEPVPGFETIPDGAVLDYATLPTTHLNFRANTSPAVIGSVRFALDANANFRTESTAPYAFAGDSAGNFNVWTPAVGGYTLSVTPYSGSGATGAAGAALTLHFQVTNGAPADSVAPSVPANVAADTLASTSFRLTWSASTDDAGVTGYEVFRDGVSAGTANGTSKTITGLAADTTYAMTVRARDAAGNWSAQSSPLNVHTAPPPPTMTVQSFSLIDADTDQPVPGFETIANGAAIARSSLPTARLNVRVNPSPATVGSVTIKLDSKTVTESVAPYAFFGDSGGDYKSGTIADGAHVVTAKPYSGANASGTAGTALTVSFTIE